MAKTSQSMKASPKKLNFGRRQATRMALKVSAIYLAAALFVGVIVFPRLPNMTNTFGGDYMASSAWEIERAYSTRNRFVQLHAADIRPTGVTQVVSSNEQYTYLAAEVEGQYLLVFTAAPPSGSAETGYNVTGVLKRAGEWEASIIDEAVGRRTVKDATGLVTMEVQPLYYMVDATAGRTMYYAAYFIVLLVEAFFLGCIATFHIRIRGYRRGHSYLSMSASVFSLQGQVAQLPDDLAADPLLGRPQMKETGNAIHDYWYRSAGTGDIKGADKVNAMVSADVANGFKLKRRGLWITENFLIRQRFVSYTVLPLKTFDWFFVLGFKKLPGEKRNWRSCLIVYHSTERMRIPARGRRDARKLHALLTKLCPNALTEYGDDIMFAYKHDYGKFIKIVNDKKIS